MTHSAAIEKAIEIMASSGMQKGLQQDARSALLGPLSYLQKHEEKMEKLLDPKTLDEGIAIRAAMKEAGIDGRLLQIDERLSEQKLNGQVSRAAVPAKYRVEITAGAHLVGDAITLVATISALGVGRKARA